MYNMTEQGILSAEDFVSWKLKSGILKVPVPPQTVILSMQSYRLKGLFASRSHVRIKGLAGRHICMDKANGVFVSSGWGIGAPALIALCEEFRALGTLRFILVGYFGRLTSDVPEGESVFCGTAIAEEGTSRYYSGSKLTVTTISSDQLAAIKDGTHASEYSVVSTDAPFRETQSLAKGWKKEGANLIDMETSALYNFASYYGLEAVSLGVAADLLDDDKWIKPVNSSLLRSKMTDTVDNIIKLLK